MNWFTFGGVTVIHRLWEDGRRVWTHSFKVTHQTKCELDLSEPERTEQDEGLVLSPLGSVHRKHSSVNAVNRNDSIVL